MRALAPNEVRPPPDPLIGCSLGGRFHITALLGCGGMSRVYQAEQLPLQREVALKVLKDDSSDPTLQRRFLFEASTTSKLTHPNTITIFEYGADQGLLFFAMELLRGRNLLDALKRDRQFSEERTLRIARQICRSLREAHVRGLVHRDLKPSNLFLLDHADEPDFVKVLDFGIAKVFGVEEPQPTGKGLVFGTPHYMAPEQARGLECDQRSDIYSLGVVLFQMLAGRLPYAGSTATDVLVRHALEAVPRLSHACPGLKITPQLEQVVARCMAKKPGDRFRDMDELLAALPGDRPAGPRPPPLPLDFEIEDWEDEPGSAPLITAGLDARGDTRQISAKQPIVRIEPPVVQPVQAAPPPRSSKLGPMLAAGAVAVVLAVGTSVGLHASAGAKQPAAVPAAAAPAPPAAVKPMPAAVVEPVEIRPAPVAEPQPASEPAPAPAASPKPSPRRSERRIASAAARSKPVLEPASPEVIEELNERLGRALAGIRQCAMIESRRGRDAEQGEVELAVIVDGSGRLTEIGITGARGELERCVRGAVQRIAFEPFQGAPAAVKRTFSLAPK